MLDFWLFVRDRLGPATSVLSLRDLRAWGSFISTTASKIGSWAAYVHGAHLVFLDGIGLGMGMPAEVFPTSHAALVIHPSYSIEAFPKNFIHHGQTHHSNSIALL